MVYTKVHKFTPYVISLTPPFFFINQKCSLEKQAYIYILKNCYTYNSLNFPIELNSRDSKTPTTFTSVHTNYYNGKLSINIFFLAHSYELKTLYGL